MSSAAFWRRCAGSRKARRSWPVCYPHTVRHPLLTVPGGDSTQRELSMDIRYAFRSNGPSPDCLLGVGRVVPFFGSHAP
jgi:hypothetical protein